MPASKNPKCLLLHKDCCSSARDEMEDVAFVKYDALTPIWATMSVSSNAQGHAHMWDEIIRTLDECLYCCGLEVRQVGNAGAFPIFSL